MMIKQKLSGLIGAVIGGIITGLVMHFAFQKPELEKQKFLSIADRVHTTLSETLINTQNVDKSVQNYIVRMLDIDMYDLMVYYDKTKDCEIGQKIKNYLNILIDLTSDKKKNQNGKIKSE